MAFVDQRRLLVCGALACLVAAVPAQAEIARAPRDIVVRIYKISAGKNGKYDGPSAIYDMNVRIRYFSKALSAALSAKERKSAKTEEPVFDFDPITNSQDPVVKDLAIEAEEQTDSMAIVAARFWSFDEKDASLVRYHFIKEGKLWKLDEISGNERGNEKAASWSLRAIIK